MTALVPVESPPSLPAEVRQSFAALEAATTVAEVTQVLRLEEHAVRRLLRNGSIPGEVRVGSRVFVNRERLAEYLRGRDQREAS